MVCGRCEVEIGEVDGGMMMGTAGRRQREGLQEIPTRKNEAFELCAGNQPGREQPCDRKGTDNCNNVQLSSRERR